MRARNGTVALLLLATCSEEARDVDSSASLGIESFKRRLGTVPLSESAVWRKVGASSTPGPRYLHAAAFDSARQVVVMFGGADTSADTGVPLPPNRETWEWSTTTGAWSNRTGTGSAPAARSGAAIVYDAKRARLVLFGGRAPSGRNYEDTWEWDPAAGAWTDVTSAGTHPSARSQAAMVYQASTGKILLFGGGRSDEASFNAAGVATSDGDTWELDPATHVWTALKPTVAPSPRHDLGLVWDKARNKAVLFGGMQVDMSGVPGILKQDIWEWDPATAAWTERTSAGSKPEPRYGHAMAYDGGRGKIVVVGGFAIDPGQNVADAWDWDPTTGAWTERMTGSETPMPTPRRYASLVYDDTRARLELVAGATDLPNTGPENILGSREVWELDPSKPAFTDRTVAPDVPSARSGHCMAYHSATGKVYLFGGSRATTGELLDDFWAWDGKAWSRIAAESRPPARSEAAMAFDPVRESLILFGGYDDLSGTSDTWEWTPAEGWMQQTPATSPRVRSAHGLVTDTTRDKLLLFGGADYTHFPIEDAALRDVWEWDGTTGSWTDRTPTSPSDYPEEPRFPLMAYDSGQKKLLLYEIGLTSSTGIGGYWQWDPISAGWTRQEIEVTEGSYPMATAYDSIRRRAVFLAQRFDPLSGNFHSETWELDTNSQTMYVRTVAPPGGGAGATMVFDSTRGVMVLFGGDLDSGTVTNETWEYRVTGLGNGVGCTAAFAASCASGFCVDGVCCEAAACSGACKSCNVRGSEGTCVLATAGTEVPDSCSAGQACDGQGHCLPGNGQPCTTAGACASGFCTDGVCCDSACDGVCVACDQTGQLGTCAPLAAGTDPQQECGQGTGACTSACDGVSGCGFPRSYVACDKCMGCDGAGTCSVRDPLCYPGPGTGGHGYGTGGTGGSTIGTGGYGYPSGGAGGSRTAPAGFGGTGQRGGAVGTTLLGGSTGAAGRPSGLGGSARASGGVAGTSVEAGGTIGPGGRADGGMGGKMGGSTVGLGGSRDAGSDAAGTRPHGSGCSCGLDHAAGSPLPAPFLVSIVGLLAVRIRRRLRRPDAPPAGGSR